MINIRNIFNFTYLLKNYNYTISNNINKKLLIPLLLYTILPFSSSFGNCLTKDEKGNIVYNKDSNKKCVLIRTINSNERNQLTDKGLEQINGKSCKFDEGYNYLNGENLSGQTLPNGQSRQVKCNSGYSGNIILKCNNGVIDNIGDDGVCKFNGCTKYSDGKYNGNYIKLLEKINFNFIDTDIETLKETNNTKTYLADEVIDIIPCNENELDYINDNGGWTIKCDNNADFIIDGNGCTFKSGIKEFNYTGGIQQFEIPKALKDKNVTFELYGAAGNDGAGGGYTKLTSRLVNKFGVGTILYVVIGGAGSTSSSGGYNGGGARGYATGGGATHIATKDGTLSTLSNNKDSILAVAGGAGSHSNYGGGANMSGGSDASAGECGGSGGTLASGGIGYSSGSFGQGGAGGSNGLGGGGGYYGGGGSTAWCGSGGGSGYCNTSYGFCSGSNDQRSGDGYVKISW